MAIPNFLSSGSNPSNAKEAYSIVEEAYEAYGENRRMIGADYKSQVGAARAKMGASGFVMEGPAWQGIKGNLIRNRDEAMGLVDEEEAVFQAGTAFGIVKADFEQMTGVNVHRPAPGQGGGDAGTGRQTTTYSLRTGSAASGESFLTDEQKGMIKKYGPQQDLYAYAASIKPTWAEYEKFRFGSAQDKAAFSDSMTTRIEASNKKFYRMGVAKKVTQAQQGGWVGHGDRREWVGPRPPRPAAPNPYAATTSRKSDK